MERLRVAFSGFWHDFSPENNIVTEILKRKFNVQIVCDKDGKEADILFYTNFSMDFYEYSCPRIFVTGENLCPDFNLCDYAIGFEEMTINDRYMRWPLPYWNYRDDVKFTEERENIDFDVWKQRKFCAAVISNGEFAETFRNQLLQIMIDEHNIDSGGRYLNNIEEKEGVADKQAFLSKYRFSLALENCSHPGYCTEKIYQSFVAGNIPIYWGDPDIEKWINGKAFINCSGFDKAEDAVIYIDSIVRNDEKCYDMLRQPIYLPEQKKLKGYDKEFETWIFNILEQPKEKRFRRASNGTVRIYEKRIAGGIATEKLVNRYPILGKVLQNDRKR